MRVLLVLALIISATCALPQRIVGGQPATIEQFPFMVSLQYGFFEGAYSLRCSGSLITKTAVLSFTESFRDIPPVSRLRARVGSSRIASGGTLHRISRFIIHPKYDEWMKTNDVTVLFLDSPATLSESVNLARIAGPNYPLPDDLRVYHVGYGSTRLVGPIPETMHYVDSKIINHDICTERYDYLRSQPNFETWPRVTPDMICTGILDVGGQGACHGDGGGPVIHGGDVIVGIVSWAFHCAHPIYPDVNTRVPSFAHWIYDTTLTAA